MDGIDQTITSSPGAWRKGTLRFKGVDDVVASSGGWTASDTYTLKVVRYRTPYVTTYKMQFTGDDMHLTVDQNVGPPETLTRELLGHKTAAQTSGEPSGR